MESSIMKILLVDDDVQEYKLLNHEVMNTFPHCEIKHISMENELRHCLKNEEYDVVVTDLSMPLMTGYDVCNIVRDVSPSQRIVILTGTSPFIDKKMAIDQGAQDIFTKKLGYVEFIDYLYGIQKKE